MAEIFARIGINLKSEWASLFNKLQKKLKVNKTEVIQKALIALAKEEGVIIEDGTNH